MEKKGKTRDKIVNLLKTNENLNLKTISDILQIKIDALSHLIRYPSTKEPIYLKKERIGSSFITFASLKPFDANIPIGQILHPNNDEHLLPPGHPSKTQVEKIPQVEKPSKPQVEKSQPMALSTPEKSTPEPTRIEKSILNSKYEYAFDKSLEINALEKQIEHLQTMLQESDNALEKSKKSLKLEDIINPRINIRRLMGIYDLLFNKTPNGTNIIDLAQELINELEKFKQLQKELQKVK